MPVNAKDILAEFDKQQPKPDSTSAKDILNDFDKGVKKKDAGGAPAPSVSVPAPSVSSVTKTKPISSLALESPFTAHEPKLTTKDGTQIAIDSKKIPSVVNIADIQKRINEGTQTSFDEDVIAMATGKSKKVVNAYLKDKYVGMSMETQEDIAKEKETLYNSIAGYNKTFGTKYDPQQVLSSAQKSADFLKEIKISANKRRTEQLAFEKSLQDKPDEKMMVMQDGKLTAVSRKEYYKNTKSEVLDPTSLINQVGDYVKMLQKHVVKQTVEEDRKNGIAVDKTINKIAERLNPKEYQNLQMAQVRMPQNPTSPNLFQAAGDLKDMVFGTEEKKQLLNVFKGEAEVKYNEMLEEIGKDKVSRGVLTMNEGLVLEGQKDLKDVNHDAIYKYPALLKQGIAKEVSEEIAKESGQLKESETQGATGLLEKVFGGTRYDYERIMRAKGYLDNPKTKDAAMSLLSNTSLFSDASYLGTLGQSFIKPFKDLGLSIGDITGFRNASDIFSDRIKDQLFPEETSGIKQSAKVTRHIVNTTANLAGMMVIAGVTEGVGTAGGLTPAAAKALGAYTSFGLPSFDASLKDAYDFIDSEPARYLYASMNAIANAEGGRVLDLGKITRIPGVSEDFAKLAKGLSEKTITKDAAEELLNEASTKYVDFALKYGKNVIKGAAVMTAFNIKDHILKMAFNDPATNSDNTETDAAHAFIDGVTGMSIIGAFGASADMSKERNTSYKKFIYDIATHHDAAEDVFKMGFNEGKYSKEEFDLKMAVVNSAKVAKEHMDAIQAKNDLKLSPDQKAVYVSNKTVESMIRQKIDRLEDGPEKEKLTAQANRLAAQSNDVVGGLRFTPTLEPHKELFDAEKKYDEALDKYKDGEVSEDKLAEEKGNYDKALQIAVTYPKKQGETRTTEGGASVIEPTAKSSARVSVQMPSQVGKPNVIDLVKPNDPQLNEARNIVNAAKVDPTNNYVFQELVDAANNNPELFKQALKDIAQQGHDPRSQEAAETAYGKEVVAKAKEMFPKAEEEGDKSVATKSGEKEVPLKVQGIQARISEIEEATAKGENAEGSYPGELKDLKEQLSAELSKAKLETDGQQSGQQEPGKEPGGTTEVKSNAEGLQYNGRDAIGSRERSKSEQDASRASAKEKIKNPDTNASLKAANSYAQSVGIPEVTPHAFKPSDKDQQSKIAELYPQLQDVNSPDYKETDLERNIYDGYKRMYPEIIEQYEIKDYKDLVQKAYAQLAKEVQLQYEALPVKVTFHQGKGNYENSAEMLDDVHNFNHLWVYRGGDDHTAIGSKTTDKDGLTINDKFRAVHDYFGHSIEGYQFGKDGEENAWIEHSKMFSPLAQWALSSETRGQNSYVNYSGVNEVPLKKLSLGSTLKSEGKRRGDAEMEKEGEKLIKEANREFNYAEQKAIVLPAEHTDISSFHKDAPKKIPDPLKTSFPKEEPGIVISSAAELEKALDDLLGPIKGHGALSKMGEASGVDQRPSGDPVTNYDSPSKIMDQASVYFKGDAQIQEAIDLLRPIIDKNPQIHIDTEAKLPDNTLGLAHPDGKVQLNFDQLTDYDSLYRTALHELIHAATRNEIDKNPAFKEELAHALGEVREALGLTSVGDLISHLVANKIISKDAYGAANEHEMVAEVFTNKAFNDFLKNIEYKGDNMLKRIINRVLQFLSDAYKEVGAVKKNIQATNIADFITQLTKAVVKEPGEGKGEAKEMIKPDDSLQKIVDAARKSMKDEDVEGMLSKKGIPKPTIDALMGRGDESVTGIKNALTAAERKLRGLGEIEVTAKRGFEQVWENAKVLVESGKRDPRVMARELAGNPRSLDPEESAMLVYDRMRLYNEHEDALNALIQARKTNNKEQEVEAATRMGYIEDQIKTNDEAARKTGYEQGLGLAIRRLLALRDYSLPNQIRMLESEYGGKIPEEVRARLEQYDRDLKEANKKLEEYEEKWKQKKAQATVDKAAKEGRKAKVKDSIEKIKTDRKNLLDELKKIRDEGNDIQKMGVNLPNKAIPIIGKIALTYVKEVIARAEGGVIKLEEIVDGVFEDVKDTFDGITKRDIRDAISGYGVDRKPTEKETQKQLNEIKAQARLVSALEDVMMGKTPEKKSSGKKQSSQEVKDLRTQLTQAMKDAGMIIDKSYKTPEERAAIALKSVKSRFKNQIKKLNDYIETGRKTDEKGEVVYDDEAKMLRSERDRLQKIADEMDSSKDESPDELIQKASRALQRQIDTYEKKIKENKKPGGKKGAPMTPELEAMTNRLNELKSEYKKMQTDSYEEVLQHNKLEEFKDRLKKKKASLEDRTAKKDFSEPDAEKPFELDEEAVRLKAEVKKAEDKFDKERKKAELANRSPTKKALDFMLKWRRFAILSGLSTLGKLTTAASGRMIITPMEELEGALMARLPILSTISAQAPREGGLNISAEVKAISQIFQRATYQDIVDILKTGKGSLDVLYGKNNELPPEALDFFGQLHSALKVTPKRAEFYRSFEKRLAFSASKGIDPHDPVLQATIAADAYIDANRAIFMQDNPLTEGYQKLVKFFEGKGAGGEMAAAALKFFFPIVKVPTNYVGEVTSYSLGVVKAAFAMRNGIKDLEPEKADYIIRNFKKGFIGLGVLALGYFNPQLSGGYHQPFEKRKKDEPEAGQLEFFGVKLPKWMGHIPLIEMLHLGATIRRVHDKYKAKDEMAKDWAGVRAGALGVIEEVPFFGMPIQIGEASKSEQSGKFFLGQEVKSFLEPRLLQEIAEAHDSDRGFINAFITGEHKKRKTKTITDALKSGIPGLREELKEKK